MRIRPCQALPSLALCLLCLHAFPQSVPSANCSLTLPGFTSNAPNIFSDQQEQYLGEALAEHEESDLRLAPTGPDDQMTRIGEKLLAGLPPTGVHYRFRIYDSGEINGFSFGGGRVYISRKLIASIKNEDELAGVLAHEIGHIYTHQTAIELTHALRIRLGITQVTDRADIFAKVHLFFSTPPKQGEEQDREKVDQLIADRVALYAMVAAGYAPGSFVSFMDESMINKGKTGSWLTDAMGLTGEASQRYRTALKLISVLPPGCKDIQPSSGTAFATWQKNVVEERAKSIAEAITGDRPIKLDPPLRPSPWRIRFSPDGLFALVQDDASITVVDRNAAKVLFRVDAPETEAAQFTPDSQSLVFHDTNLRIEKWSVASGQRTGVKELVVFDGCTQSLLSPDGKTLVCANLNVSNDLPRVSLRLIDVESGKPFYDKPAFAEPNIYNQVWDIFQLAIEGMSRSNIASMIASPDGKYLVVAVTDHVLAYDLEHRQPVSLGGKLRDLQQGRMSFLGSDQLYVVSRTMEKGLHEASVLSFPDGHLIKQSFIGDQQVESVTHGRYLVASPLKDFAAGVWDPAVAHFVGTSKFSAIDVWDKLSASEDPTGGLQLGDLGSKTYSIISLPLGPLPALHAAAFSPNGKYLAVSMRNRAELWNLETGKQIGLIRPFRSAWVDQQDHLFGQFPKYLEKEPVQYDMTLTPLSARDLSKFEAHDWQYRNLEYTFKPIDKGKSTNHHATFEVRHMGSQAIAWSRDYPHEIPAPWPAEDNRFVLAWDLSTEGSKGELKNFPNLQPQVEALKNKKKGLLLEIVDAETGAALNQIILPEADLSKGSDDERRARVSGQFVLVRGEHGNTVIYGLKDGSKVGEFFGSVVATDAQTGLIAATNREDEIILVEEHTGKELQRFSLGSPVRLTQITTGKDKALLVLTADQVVHRLPLPEASTRETALSRSPNP